MKTITVKENEYSGEYCSWKPSGIISNVPAGIYNIYDEGKTFHAYGSVKHSYRNVIPKPIKVIS
jgi:hypothetical protein